MRRFGQEPGFQAELLRVTDPRSKKFVQLAKTFMDSSYERNEIEKV